MSPYVSATLELAAWWATQRTFATTPTPAATAAQARAIAQRWRLGPEMAAQLGRQAAKLL